MRWRWVNWFSITAMSLVACAQLPLAWATAQTNQSLEQQSIELVQQRVSLWFERKRTYQLSPVLEQLARVAPNDPELYSYRIQVALLEKDQALVEQLWQQLQQLAPGHPATMRTAELLALQSDYQAALAQARLLAVAGRYQEAWDQYQQVFARPPLTLDMAIEYWRVAARAGERERALTQLEKLQRQHPDSIALELAVISERFALDRLTSVDLQRLTRLSLDPLFGGEAFSLWQRIMPTLAPQPDHLRALERLAIYFPKQAEIQRYRTEMVTAMRNQPAPAATVSASVQVAENPPQPVVNEEPIDQVETSVEELVAEQPRPLESNVIAEPTEVAQVAEVTPSEAREKVLWLGYDFASRDSTDGISSLQVQTLMVRLNIPMTDDPEGTWFIQVDPTKANAGAADLDNSFWRNRFGTGLLCQQNCPSGLQPSATDSGVAVGVGGEWEDWHADVGLSPLGFDRHVLVGSLGYDGGELGEFGWGAEFERRVLSSALVNFAGIDDPFSESRFWGPVVRNNLGLSLSWDQGTGWGWWSNAGMNWYRGDNVLNNRQWYAYTGVYTTFYDTEAFAIDTGFTVLSWGYQHDQSQNTYGHGGYYSPRHYLSASIPITLYGRINRFSYRVRASFGNSWTKLADADFFPAHPELQQQALALQPATGIEPVYLGGTGGGFGRSIQATMEYRLTRHWYVGLSAEIERSEFYDPNNFLLYFRYQFGGTAAPVRRPPQPPQRYVDDPWWW